MGKRAEQLHVTELWEIPPDPKAVYDRNGHIKDSFVERIWGKDPGRKEVPMAQRTEIVGHVDIGEGCAVCKEKRRMTRGDLPEGSLPFEEKESA